MESIKTVVYEGTGAIGEITAGGLTLIYSLMSINVTSVLFWLLTTTTTVWVPEVVWVTT